MTSDALGERERQLISSESSLYYAVDVDFVSGHCGVAVRARFHPFYCYVLEVHCPTCQQSAASQSFLLCNCLIKAVSVSPSLT